MLILNCYYLLQTKNVSFFTFMVIEKIMMIKIIVQFFAFVNTIFLFLIIFLSIWKPSIQLLFDNNIFMTVNLSCL